MPKNLREKMLQEMEHKGIFRQVQDYALDYADIVRDRNGHTIESTLFKRYVNKL